MYKIIFAFFLLISFLFKAEAQLTNYCIPNRFSETPLFDSSEIKIDTNIVFASAKNYFTNVMTTLRMDYYYPDRNIDSLSLRPFILLIHGGAYLAGSRKDMNYKCMELARRGFVTATIDYRIGWDCSSTDFLSICVYCGNLNSKFKTATYSAAQDARAAMRFIYANAGAYGIDTANLFIGGESAGAIAALHATFWTQAEANVFNSAAVSQVGLLDTAGNDLPRAYSIKGVINSCGAVTKDSILLNKGIIPVINFADEYDCVVPPGYGQVVSCFCTSFFYDAGSAAIYNMLTKNGICSEYHQVPTTVSHCSFPQLPLIQDASCFLKRVMCNTCQSSFSNVPYAPATCNEISGLESNGKVMNDLSFTFANPVNSELILLFTEPVRKPVKVLITDMTGRAIQSICKNSGNNSITFSTQNLSSGMYSITVNDGEVFITKKLVVLAGN